MPSTTHPSTNPGTCMRTCSQNQAGACACVYPQNQAHASAHLGRMAQVSACTGAWSSSQSACAWMSSTPCRRRQRTCLRRWRTGCRRCGMRACRLCRSWMSSEWLRLAAQSVCACEYIHVCVLVSAHVCVCLHGQVCPLWTNEQQTVHIRRDG